MPAFESADLLALLLLFAMLLTSLHYGCSERYLEAPTQTSACSRQVRGARTHAGRTTEVAGPTYRDVIVGWVGFCRFTGDREIREAACSSRHFRGEALMPRRLAQAPQGAVVGAREESYRLEPIQTLGVASPFSMPVAVIFIG